MTLQFPFGELIDVINSRNNTGTQGEILLPIESEIASWDNLSDDIVSELMIWERVSDQDLLYAETLPE